MTAVQHHGDVRAAGGDLVEEQVEFLVEQVWYAPAVGAGQAAVAADEGLQVTARLGLPVVLRDRFLAAVPAEPEQRDVTSDGTAKVASDGPDQRVARGVVVAQHQATQPRNGCLGYSSIPTSSA